jgi:hypothetical protein
LILLGDWASVYLAFLNRENPTPVNAIEDFKKRLKEQTEERNQGGNEPGNLSRV